MVYDRMDTDCMEDGEPSNVATGIPAEQFSPASFLSNHLCCEMSLPELAAQCLRELGNYRRGEPCTDAYGLELLRHPQREVACCLEREENYVAQTFERFWQATAFNQQVEFSTLAAALQYLCASLHGAILDMLRAYARPGEVPLPGPGEPGEPLVVDNTENGEVLESLKAILLNPREQRLAYLLFHCGLKPREIIRFCQQEWSDVQEIYRLRRAIMERVLRNADRLRWRLSERG